MLCLKGKKRMFLSLLLIILMVATFLLIYNPFVKENSLDIPFVENRILSLGELTTIEYHYKTLFKYQDAKELKGIILPFTTKSLFIIYEGYIKAGVDLKDVSIQVDDNNNIVVQLKKATFTDNVIKEESVKVYDERSGLLNPLKLEEVFELLEGEKKKALQELKEDGFLEEANQRAVKLLIPLLKEMGFNRIDIQFQD